MLFIEQRNHQKTSREANDGRLLGAYLAGKRQTPAAMVVRAAMLTGLAMVDTL